MLNFKLPVYAVRAYEELFDEGDFLIVQTQKARWVLDCPSLEGTYYERRLMMLGMDLPYKLYPLKKRISTISQLIHSQSRLLIDEQGRLLKWKKEKMYSIEVKKILSRYRTQKGTWVCYAQGFQSPFELSGYYEYVSIINVAGSPIVFDVHESMPETPRLRVKL
ncbi:hypothetical protein CPT_Slocum_157 [Serratia phage Slocum]|nr:hypothetical protein CPT_Slocum_157 [Serratia phage Slocum]URC22553.1 hypothetical protein KAMAJI_01250 [Serratia phage vB_SmaM-Kamaji]